MELTSGNDLFHLRHHDSLIAIPNQRRPDQDAVTQRVNRTGGVPGVGLPRMAASRSLRLLLRPGIRAAQDTGENQCRRNPQDLTESLHDILSWWAQALDRRLSVAAPGAAPAEPLALLQFLRALAYLAGVMTSHAPPAVFVPALAWNPMNVTRPNLSAMTVWD